MADHDRTILDFYQLSTLDPDTWPAEKNEEQESSEDEDARKRKKIEKRKSRYHALERVVSDRRSIVSTASGTRGGAGNLIQKDEPDPLGSFDSVVRQLKQMNLPVHENASLRGLHARSNT